jgi:hypothetical protein
MPLTKADAARVLSAFDGLPIDAPLTELAEFATATLSLNVSQAANVFPETASQADDDRRVQLERLAASLIARRKQILEKEGRVPNNVICKEMAPIFGRPIYNVGGLASYLAENNESEVFVNRIRQHDAIRGYLAGMGDGFKLESLAAVILERIYENCFATRRVFDQGIDCVSTHSILEVQSWCCGDDLLRRLSRIGERVHIVASCKANEGNTALGTPDTIPPAHVRELIGGWLIQRSDAGMWNRKAGVKLLSPLQLLLATTYRLSDASMSLCRELGVAVWSIPHLVYLLCAHAPASVFPVAGAITSFSEAEMDAWIATTEANRAAVV